MGHEGLMENTKYLNKMYAMCMPCADSYGSRLLPTFQNRPPRRQGGYPHVVLRGVSVRCFMIKSVEIAMAKMDRRNAIE